jgi:hypothetical protein
MSKKLGIPLSTIQRRRTRLERSVLTKRYELNAQDMGWRNAEILMLVNDGSTDRTAKALLEKFDAIIGMSTRVNTKSNLAAYIAFRKTDQLHELMELLRSFPNLSNLEWSEVVKDSDNKGKRLAHLIFNSKD